MNIELEHLKLLPAILSNLELLEKETTAHHAKRWMTSKELSQYMGYSIDAINKMVKEEVFIAGVHYYQPSKKLLFDRIEIDQWIVGMKHENKTSDVHAIVQTLLGTL